MAEADVITIIVAVVGVIGISIGAVLGGLITFYTTRKNDLDRLIREKCEEIYDLSVQIKRWIDNEIDSWWLRYNEDAIIIPSPSENLPCPIDNLLMLVHLYATPLEEKALKMSRTVGTFNNLEYHFAEAEWDAFQMGVGNFLSDERRKNREAQEAFVASIKKFVNNH